MFSCLLDTRQMSGVWRHFSGSLTDAAECRFGPSLPGGDRRGVTPVPMPNTVVKPSTADGTARVTVWESRSLPGFIPKPEVDVVSGFALYECSDLFGVFLSIFSSHQCFVKLREVAVAHHLAVARFDVDARRRQSPCSLLGR